MKADPPQVAAARIEAARARGRLMESAHALQARLSPNVLARDAWEGVKMKGADLAEDAVDAVRARPLATTGVVAALAMFLAREPLMGLAGKLIDGGGDKREAKKAAKRSPATKSAPPNSETETVE